MTNIHHARALGRARGEAAALGIASLTQPACVGHWALFDSIDEADHRLAKQLCDTCPDMAPCALILASLAQAPDGHRPTGTWAGQLLGGPGRPGRPGREDAA